MRSFIEARWPGRRRNQMNLRTSPPRLCFPPSLSLGQEENLSNSNKTKRSSRKTRAEGKKRRGKRWPCSHFPATNEPPVQERKMNMLSSAEIHGASSKPAVSQTMYRRFPVLPVFPGGETFCPASSLRPSQGAIGKLKEKSEGVCSAEGGSLPLGGRGSSRWRECESDSQSPDWVVWARVLPKRTLVGAAFRYGPAGGLDYPVAKRRERRGSGSLTLS